MSGLQYWLVGAVSLLAAAGFVVGYMAARFAFKAELLMSRHVIDALREENQTLRDQVVATWAEKWVECDENAREVRFSARADLELGQPVSPRLAGDSWLTREEQQLASRGIGEEWRHD